MIGKTVSHYRMIDKLGQGGMGEVYRAEDTNLHRHVAVKVLPDEFARDPERLARFQREAEVLSSLNHPNVATLYGLEESDGKRFIVMELVSGETLANRLLKRPLPVEEALQVCRQIAEGLEAAHEKGVIHRDLKPGNVMITPDDKVKILDFGLAKAQAAQSAAGGTESPTITEAMTRAGTILGTAAYMSPEQAKGKPVDKRTDIWSFGCILYECLTGKAPFKGETVTETVAKILEGTPDWDLLPPSTPWRTKDLLHRCLQRNPKERLRDIGDAGIEIEQLLRTSGTSEPNRTAPVSLFALGLTGLACLIVGALATGMIYHQLRPSAEPPSARVIRALVSLAPADRLQSGPNDIRFAEQRPSEIALALSPDGRLLVFSAVKGDRQQLYLRSMDNLEATPISESEDAASPFFSPDGMWIGFWAKGALKKIPVSGGPATVICETTRFFGASWGDNGQIVFARTTGGLLQVPAAGGTPRLLTKLDENKGETSHRLPQILPGGRAVLFTATTHFLPDWNETEVQLQLLPSGERRVLTRGADARYVPTGHLVFVRSGALVAAPFDAGKLKLNGSEVTILSNVMQAANTPNSATESGLAQWAVSSSGLLVYATGGIFPEQERRLVWVDRAGKEEPLPLPPRAYVGPHLSPDGQRILLWTQGRERTVWIFNILRGTMTRITTEGRNSRAIWTPDGRRVTFASATAGPEYVALKEPDTSAKGERLCGPGDPSSWSPDGRVIAYVYPPALGAPNNTICLFTLGDTAPRPLTNSRFAETYPEFSPDGRWIAYVSNETGKNEVYVQPYPGLGSKQQLSNNGGTQPAWTQNGRELLYTEVDAQTRRVRMMSVPLTVGNGLGFGVPRFLWEGQFRGQEITRGYDVTPDGQRFLMVQPKERPPMPVTQLIMVQNWFEELKRLVPTGKK